MNPFSVVTCVRGNRKASVFGTFSAASAALRLDADVLAEIALNGDLDGVVARFGSHALTRRLRLVKEVYAL